MTGYNTGEIHEEINRSLADNLSMRDEAALKYVLASPDGRWFISRLLQSCHVFSALGVYRTDGTVAMDTNAMLLQEGERRVGLNVRRNIIALTDGMNMLHTMEREAESVERQMAEIRKSIIAKYE